MKYNQHLKSMKKIILLLMTFFSFSTVTFASFPVVETDSVEFVSNNQAESNSPDSKLIGILLGVFLGIFGVLIAYLMDDDEMVRGAWRGFLWSILIFLIIWILIFVSVASTVAVAV